MVSGRWSVGVRWFSAGLLKVSDGHLNMLRDFWKVSDNLEKVSDDI